MLLPPFSLAASQWEPALEILAKHFTTIVLGGRHIGGVPMLEDRAALPGFRDLVTILTGRMAMPHGASMLDAGCGPGAVCHQIPASRPDLSLVGLDTNAYLLREGAEIACDAGIPMTGPDPDVELASGTLHLVEGDATNLSFPDRSFDAALSVTVLEECNAGRALQELFRVLRPGTPVAVRAIDMSQWWNLDLPPDLAVKAAIQPQSMSPGAVADRSLYRRVTEAGFVETRGFPYLLTLDRPGGPIWSYRTGHTRSQMNPDGQAIWDRACADAEASGLLFQANPIHCAVAWRPLIGDRQPNRNGC